MHSSSRVRTLRVLCLSAAVVSAAFVCSETAAQGWLAGASIGNAKQYDYEVGGPITTTDDSDTGYRAFGGYLFLPVFGIVTSYVDLGSMHYDGPAFGGFTDDLSAEGVDLSLLAGWAPGQQKRFSLFGTVGIFGWSQDVHYVDSTGVYDYTDRGTSFSYGAGGEFAFGAAAQWGIHISWQRFMDVGDADNSGHEYDRDLISVGFDYRFGR